MAPEILSNAARAHKVRMASKRSLMNRFRDDAVYLPLLAALFAPVSTLLDIPGLSQPWFLFTDAAGVTSNIADPAGSRILSAFSLAFNLVANVLIFLRFTASPKYWRQLMQISVISWTVKVLVALVNLAVYGRYKNNGPGFSYSQGFWAACASCIIAGVIALSLITHWAVRRSLPSGSAEDIRVAGARYQLAVTAFLALIGIQALIFSRLEHWTFVTGLYFSLVTSLTIGYGDYQPTHVSTRILDFPFAVMSISLLAVMLSQLIGFISSRTSRRKEAFRKHFEDEFTQRREEADGEKKFSLVVELAELQDMERQEEQLNQTFDLVMSFASLIVFWCIGAACFHAIEGWATGTAFYYCYVTFLTIGYGDFSPSTAGGQVFFLIWALLAVPIVTNVIVQTVIGTLNGVADSFAQKAQDKRAPEDSELEHYHSHAYNLQMMADRLTKMQDERDSAEQLSALVLALAIKLEAQSRALLLDCLPSGSKAQQLMHAETLLMKRVTDSLEAEVRHLHPTATEKAAAALLSSLHAHKSKTSSEDKEPGQKELPEDSTIEAYQQEDCLNQVGRYRLTFAALLAAGSRMLALEGHERWYFERRLEDHDKLDQGGISLGAGRKGPAEVAAGVDV